MVFPTVRISDMFPSIYMSFYRVQATFVASHVHHCRVSIVEETLRPSEMHFNHFATVELSMLKKQWLNDESNSVKAWSQASHNSCENARDVPSSHGFDDSSD